MNEEIKELLFQLEIVARKHTVELCEDGSKIETMPASVVDELRLNNYSSKLLLNYITNLQDENQKLNKIIDELEKWLKETKKFNYGLKIKSEYIYVHEFVCKNILNKLTKLKNEVK